MQTITDLRNVYLDKIGYSGENYNKRKRELVLARNAFMVACRNIFSTTMIGSAFGKSHGMAIHAYKSHDSNALFSSEYRSYYSIASTLIEEYVGATVIDPRHKPASSLKVEISFLRLQIQQTKKELSNLKKLVEKLTEKLGSELEA